MTMVELDWRDFQMGWLRTGTRGKWTLERFSIDDRLTHHDVLGRPTGSGDFIRLVAAEDGIWMGDTCAEITDHFAFFSHIRPGDSVLISGLGLGMAAAGALSLGATSVTVVEQDADVVALVGDQIVELARRLHAQATIIVADATTYQPAEAADVAFHDIWLQISDENLPQMRAMLAHYRPHVRRWQGCWSMQDAETMERIFATIRAGGDLAGDDLFYALRLASAAEMRSAPR